MEKQVVRVNDLNNKKKRVRYADEANYWVDSGGLSHKDEPKDNILLNAVYQSNDHELSAVRDDRDDLNNASGRLDHEANNREEEEDVFCDSCCFQDRCIHVRRQQDIPEESDIPDEDEETEPFSQSIVSKQRDSTNGSLENTCDVKIKRGTEVFHTRQQSNTSSTGSYAANGFHHKAAVDLHDSFLFPSATDENNQVNASFCEDDLIHLRQQSGSSISIGSAAHSRQQSSCTSGSSSLTVGSSSAASAPFFNGVNNNIHQDVSKNYPYGEESSSHNYQSFVHNPAVDESSAVGNDGTGTGQDIDYGYSSTSTSSTETSSAPSSGIFMDFQNFEIFFFSLKINHTPSLVINIL